MPMLDGDTGEEREMKTPTFIPSGEIPRGLRFRNRRFEHDSGFVHELNAEGYRSDDFHDRRDYAVLTIGCSWAFGTVSSTSAPGR